MFSSTPSDSQFARTEQAVIYCLELLVPSHVSPIHAPHFSTCP